MHCIRSSLRLHTFTASTDSVAAPVLFFTSERVSAIAETNSSAAAAASEQSAAAQAQLKEGAAERDGLVFLTNKYYDMLTKQQVRCHFLVSYI